MVLSEITACVLTRNDSYFIRHVLSPLIAKLGDVKVIDTGSTDGTIELIQSMGVEVVAKGPSTAEEVGEYRNELQRMSKTPWTMVVDSDELYHVEFFDDLARYEVEPGKIIGFTPMVSVDFVDGQYVMMDDRFSRLALHPKTMLYEREYPFESPVGFRDPGNFFYVKTDITSYHLHRLNRSPKDSEVPLRVDKQYLYSLQKVERPVLGPVTLPLDPRFSDPYESLSATRNSTTD